MIHNLSNLLVFISIIFIYSERPERRVGFLQDYFTADRTFIIITIIIQVLHFHMTGGGVTLM